MPYNYKELTERHRPHFHPPGATLFLTFRLANSIPRATLGLYNSEKDWLDAEAKRLRKLRLKDDSPELAAHEERLRQFHRQWFRRFEEILHKAETGPTWLKDERVAALVADALRWRDGKFTDSTLTASCQTTFTPSSRPTCQKQACEKSKPRLAGWSLRVTTPPWM